MYNWGFGPAGSDFSLEETSKKTVKQVLLSRPHIFQAVVFPCPITVLATAGPFCNTIPQISGSQYQTRNFISGVSVEAVEKHAYEDSW